MALYTSGSWEYPRLYALAEDGASVDLGVDVYGSASASRDGRWIATPSERPPAEAVRIVEVETGTAYTIPVTTDFTVHGTAFDPQGARLAFVEVGPPGEEGTTWAIVVVDLADGSFARFEANASPDADMLPGIPIGWSASGEVLYLDTFLPYTEGGYAGVWGITIPAGTESAPVDALERRQVLTSGSYLSRPDLSRNASRLLYVNRDYDYTPENYEPLAYDLAVNQLWATDLESRTPSLLVEETDGAALGRDAAWSPDGSQALFARGEYAGDTFEYLELKRVDETGATVDVAPMPLPGGGSLVSLKWCRPETALVTVADSDGMHELHTVDLVSGYTALIAAADYVSLVGCVSPGE